MLGITRKGPIGLDFGSDHLKMVQADFVKGSPVIRSAIILPYPTNKKELFESPTDLKKMVRKARSIGGFQGARTVVTMPPEKLQFVSLEYKCMPSKDPDEAVIEAIRERFGDQIKSSVIDFYIFALNIKIKLIAVHSLRSHKKNLSFLSWSLYARVD